MNPMPESKSKSLIARDHKLISRSYTRVDEAPLVISRAEGSWVFDPDGNKYLDFGAGIAVMNVGYNDPAVAAAIKAQLETGAWHAAFSDFYAEPPLQFVEKLLELSSRPYEQAFLCNSGTEAVECALKASFWHTKRRGVIAFYGAFHGRTLGSLSVAASKSLHKARYPSIPGIVHAPYPNLYRKSPGQPAEEHGIACARTIEKLIFKRELAAEDVAAIIVEPIQGEGGYLVPPKAFHQELRRICTEHGILLIADEVQTGCFRTGRFLAMQHFGAKPDLVCLSKAVGGGLPLGAVLAKKDTFDWPPGSHANTFGGNLLACAAGLASLQKLESRGPEIERLGQHALQRMGEWVARYPKVGDARGLGLMLGMEIVKDKESKEPAPDARSKIVAEAFKHGLVLIPCGESTIRVVPPLTISQQELDQGLDILQEALAKHAR
jgi:4-aminobutyrate aminotransferase